MLSEIVSVQNSTTTPLPSAIARVSERLQSPIRGSLLVADNAINHHVTLQPMLDRALQDERVDALIVPIGKGELICRKR